MNAPTSRLRLAAFAVALVGAGAMGAAATPSHAASHSNSSETVGDFVGQVFMENPGKVPPVVILRGKATIRKIGNYATVQPNDRIYVTDHNATVKVQIYGGDTATLDGQRERDTAHAYLVPAAPPKTAWKKPGVMKLVAMFPHLFDMPASRPATPTTPNGPKGAGVTPLTPSVLLPNRAQTLRVDPGKVLLPVVWNGGVAFVRLTQECRLVIAEGASIDPGFMVLRASNLVEDDYCIDVWPVGGNGQPDRKAGFTIPMKVVKGVMTYPDEQTAVLAAAGELRGPDAGRLQGLVDLQRQAETSFKAFVIYRAIALGDDIGESHAGN